jgi:hypothetical protein
MGLSQCPRKYPTQQYLQNNEKHGDASKLTPMIELDVVLANINRNVLLNEVAIYSKLFETLWKILM